MKEKTLLKITAMLCSTAIVIVAMFKGYDSQLALGTIIALYGGEKVLERLFKNEKKA